MGGTFLLGEKRKVNVFEHRSLLNNLKQASIKTEEFLLFENHYFHGNILGVLICPTAYDNTGDVVKI